MKQIYLDNARTFLRKKSSGKNYLFLKKGKPKSASLNKSGDSIW